MTDVTRDKIIKHKQIGEVITKFNANIAYQAFGSKGFGYLLTNVEEQLDMECMIFLLEFHNFSLLLNDDYYQNILNKIEGNNENVLQQSLNEAFSKEPIQSKPKMSILPIKQKSILQPAQSTVLARQTSFLDQPIMDCNTTNSGFCVTCNNNNISKIKFNYIEYKTFREIGRGTFSIINRYTSGDNSIVVKKFTGNNSKMEAYIEILRSYYLQYLKPYHPTFVISSYPYFNNDCYFLIMHNKENNISKLPKDLSNDNKKECFDQVINGLIELLDRKLLYLDLKLENVLFAKYGEKYKIYLADLGGIYFMENYESDIYNKDPFNKQPFTQFPKPFNKFPDFFLKKLKINKIFLMNYFIIFQ